MSLKQKLACGALLGGALAMAGPATAQTSPINSQMQILQQQIQQLQQQLQNLQSQVNESQAQARKAQDDAKAAQAQAAQAQQAAPAAAPASGPRVTLSAGNRPGFSSADGQNAIELTSRLHLDVGDYANFTPQSRFAPTRNLTSGFNARRARIGVLGKFLGDWNYALIYDFGGSTDATPGTGIENAFLTYNGFRPVAIDLGYLDVPFTLDESTSSNDIMFIERASSNVIATNLAANDARAAFGVRGNTDRLWAGVYLTGPTAGVSHTVGEQLGATGRVTYQVLQSSDYSLHVGADAEGLFKPGGSPRAVGTFSDRPELRIDPTSILTTGTIGTTANPVHDAAVFGAELAGGYGSAFFQGEGYHYIVTRDNASTLVFNGGYAQASYTLTGEHRKYNPATGAYGGIVPDHPLSLTGSGFGAFELAGRYSYIDLNDKFTSGRAAGVGGVAGGKQMVYTIGLNWYPISNVRFLLNYLHGVIDKPNGIAPATAASAPLGVGLGARFDAIALRMQVAF